MVDNPSGQGAGFLNQIQTGMPVYSRDGKQVGQVKRVVLGGQRDRTGELGVSPHDEPVPGVHEGGGMADAIADAFDPVEKLEEDFQANLMRQGFIQLGGSNLTGPANYISPEEIRAVEKGAVYLTRDYNDLTQR